jgi:hypothetical protein
MKILIVSPVYPPDFGVTTFRIKSIREALETEHTVDVLKLGDCTDLRENSLTIKRSLVYSLPYAILNRPKLGRILRSVVKRYDLIIVSATPYGIYEVARLAIRQNVPVILDLRDLPDLTTSEQKGLKPEWWLNLKCCLIMRYIVKIAWNCEGLMCVGQIATSIMQKRLQKSSCMVLNVHNGFNRDDIQFSIGHFKNEMVPKPNLLIGCVGNIYRFRDTHELRRVLKKISCFKKPTEIRHWGSITSSLLDYINSLPNIIYRRETPLSREHLLGRLSAFDCYLLPCSEDLIWEPTTSVFDYILFDKPIIFAGMRNNEAFSIIEKSRRTVIFEEHLDVIENNSFPINCEPRSLDDYYSREFQVSKLFQIIQIIKHKNRLNKKV